MKTGRVKIINLVLGRIIIAFSFHDLDFGVDYVLQWQKEKEFSSEVPAHTVIKAGLLRAKRAPSS